MAATPSTSSKRCKVDSECRGEINVLSCSRLDVLTWFFPAWPATSLSGTHLARDPKKFADPWAKVTLVFWTQALSHSFQGFL